MTFIIPRHTAEEIEQAEATTRREEYLKRNVEPANRASFEFCNKDDRKQASLLLGALLKLCERPGRIRLPDGEPDELRTRSVQRCAEDLLGAPIERELLT